MGNRAVITTEDKKMGVYLHWNGGRDSVEPMLAFCKAKGYRAPEDDDYGWACLCGVVTNFFVDGLSAGINTYENLDTDNYDNGVYIIKDWKIVGREFHDGAEQQEYDFAEFITAINDAMPEKMRLTDDELDAAVKEHHKEEVTE